MGRATYAAGDDEPVRGGLSLSRPFGERDGDEGRGQSRAHHAPGSPPRPRVISLRVNRVAPAFRMLHKIPTETLGPLGAPMTHAVETCVHCGFCLAACPTYRELGQEMDSPRGRIVLMKEVLEGTLPLSAVQPHIDRCLGCLACEPACPSGVPYRDLISPFRAFTQGKMQRSWAEKFRRFLAGQTIPFPKRFRVAAWLGRFGKFLRPLVPT